MTNELQDCLSCGARRYTSAWDIGKVLESALGGAAIGVGGYADMALGAAARHGGAATESPKPTEGRLLGGGGGMVGLAKSF